MRNWTWILKIEAEGWRILGERIWEQIWRLKSENESEAWNLRVEDEEQIWSLKVKSKKESEG
jgi:hypothetical protein